MSNIKEIEVNGTKYGIESVNDVYVGYTEPTSDIKQKIWIKPSGIYNITDTIGMETKTGSTSSSGDYTLDEEGNLVETTDTTSATGTRTTKLFALFKEHSYSLITKDSGTASSGNLYTWEVYFYDINKQFISKSTGTLPAGESYAQLQHIIDFTMPETARYIRIKVPHQNTWMACLIDGDIQVNSRYDLDYARDKFFEYDEDHYVQI